MLGYYDVNDVRVPVVSQVDVTMFRPDHEDKCAGTKMVSIMPDTDLLLNSDFVYLVTGIIFLSGAVLSTCAGKTYSGRGGWASRSAEPVQFWCAVAVLYISSLLFIGRYAGSISPGPIFHPGLWLRSQ